MYDVYVRGVQMEEEGRVSEVSNTKDRRTYKSSRPTDSIRGIAT